LWWNGLDFHQKGDTYWPPKFVPTPNDTGKEEMKKEYANFHISIALKTAPTILSKKINPKNYSVNPFQDGYKQILRNTTSYIGCVNVKLTTSM
jgi:hypothetical protein